MVEYWKGELVAVGSGKGPGRFTGTVQVLPPSFDAFASAWTV